MQLRALVLGTFALALALFGASAPRAAESLSIPAHAVIGVDEAMLSAAFWINRLDDSERVILDRKSIDVQNAALVQNDPTMHDLAALPELLARQQIVDWISNLSQRPTKPMYDSDGHVLPPAVFDSLNVDLDLGAISEKLTPHFALVVHRADLRTFPTRLRVFSEPDNVDIDRFQESALFPGTPVAIVHTSRDRKWRFVISPRYAAWVEDQYLAEGSKAEVLDYAQAQPYRIVTGATVASVFSPSHPSISQLQLDMSVRIPLQAGWPADKAVDGQHPYTAHVIELPMRQGDGALTIVPALLPKTADTQSDYLPLTRANILRQAFKFLGERYGWGHGYNARDCSGFVSDVYRSMGVLMPRNTRDQAISPGLKHRLFTERDDRTARIAAARALEVGDLVYIPGHVMMAIGSVDGEPYVIHDTTGLSYRSKDGARVHVDLNAVSVSPLLPLLFGKDQTYVERMTSIVRIRPDSATPDRAKEAPATP